MTDQFYSRASSRNGCKLGEYGPFDTREAATNHAAEKHPNAKQISSWRGVGMDIRWHDDLVRPSWKGLGPLSAG